MHDERPAHSLLSDRDLQIFRLIAAGGSGTDIAKSLNLSAKTVSTYKTRILQKMQLTSAADLIRYAMKHGLLDGATDH